MESYWLVFNFDLADNRFDFSESKGTLCYDKLRVNSKCVGLVEVDFVYDYGIIHLYIELNYISDVCKGDACMCFRMEDH